MTILSWLSVKPIMCRMMPQSFARVQKRMGSQPPQEKAAPIRWRGFFVRTANLNLTELRSFCPGFNLAEGLMVIALRCRQLIPIFGATAF
jgi:hypothetical protein